MKKSTAMLFNIGAMLCWSISPLLIRYVKDYYTVSFQNFYRFLVSILIVWIFTLVTVGRYRVIESVKTVKYLVPKLLAVAVCVFAHQFFVIKGVYTLMPGLVTIVEESIIIFSACLAFIFIPVERKLILQPLYIAGLIIAIGGVVLTAMPEGFNVVSASEVSRYRHCFCAYQFTFMGCFQPAYKALVPRYAGSCNLKPGVYTCDTLIPCFPAYRRRNRYYNEAPAVSLDSADAVGDCR